MSLSDGSDQELEKISSFEFPAEVKECVEILRSPNYNPLKLCLGQATVDEEQAEELRGALLSCKKLTHFFLIFTRLNATTMGHVLKGLKRSHTLTHLDFTGARAGDEGANVVAHFLKRNRTLTVLNLDDNRITKPGAEALSEALEVNNYLAVLTLKRNLFDKSVIRTFVAMLQINRVLVNLDLGDIKSTRLAATLRSNELFRQVLLDSLLAKPDLAKTSYNQARINVMGEKQGGKSRLLEALISDNLLDKKVLNDLRNRKDTFNVGRLVMPTMVESGGPQSVDNFPKISVREVFASQNLNYWDEEAVEIFNKQGNGFATDHVMKTVALLLATKLSPAASARMSGAKTNKRATNGGKRNTDIRRKTQLGSKRKTRTNTASMVPKLKTVRSSRASTYSGDGSEADTTSNDDESGVVEPVSEGSNIDPSLSSRRSNYPRKSGAKMNRRKSRKGTKKFSTFRSMDLNAGVPTRNNRKDTMRSQLSRGSADSSLPDTMSEFDEFDLDEEFEMRKGSQVSNTTTISGEDEDTEGRLTLDHLDKLKAQREEEGSAFRSSLDVMFHPDNRGQALTEVDKIMLDEELSGMDINLVDYVKSSEQEFQTLSVDYRTPSVHSQNKPSMNAANLRKTAYMDVPKTPVQSLYDEIHKQFESIEQKAAQKILDDETRSKSAGVKKKKTFSNVGDLDGNLRTYSLNTYKEQDRLKELSRLRNGQPRDGRLANIKNGRKPSLKSHQSMTSIASINSISAFDAHRKTRISHLKKQKASKYMKRDFSDRQFTHSKSNKNEMMLKFWEFSDNYYYDSMFCGLYSSLMTSTGHGMNIICFDLSRFLRSRKNGRRNLIYHMKMAKLRAPTKTVFVGTKLDKIKSHKEIADINTVVKEALKEVDGGGILFNSAAKLVFFPVDNVRNFGISELRKKIDKGTRGFDTVKRKLSLRELCLLDIIIACESFVQMEEVKYWAKELGIERTKLDTLLDLFKQTGHILYFPKHRTLSKIIITNPKAYLVTLGNALNPQVLNSAYNALYNDNDMESDDGNVALHSGNINNYKRNFLVSRSMVSKICAPGVEKDIFMMLLHELNLAVEWVFDPDAFFTGINLRNNISAESLNSDVFLLPSLLNDKNSVYNFQKMKRKTLLDVDGDADEEDVNELLGDDFHHEIVFEGYDKCIFPSAFFATLVVTIIKFISNLKNKFDREQAKNMRQSGRNSAQHGLSLASLQIINSTGEPGLKVVINEEFGFTLRSERGGVTLFIPDQFKKGTYAAFSFVHGMLKKVNVELLGLNIKFAILFRIDKKLKSIKQLKTRNMRTQQVFDEFVGAKTFKIAGESGFESYLRSQAS